MTSSLPIGVSIAPLVGTSARAAVDPNMAGSATPDPKAATDATPIPPFIASRRVMS
jgi:hypothetical protein